MWAALLGALVGGFLALAGAMLMAVRADRRMQIGAARQVVSQLRRSSIELSVLTEEEPEFGWHTGPFPAIRTSAWDSHAAAFVGLLSDETFAFVDRTHGDLTAWAEWGFTHQGGIRLHTRVDETIKLLMPLTRATWVDRWLLCL